MVLLGAREAGEEGEGRIWIGLEDSIVICVCVVERDDGAGVGVRASNKEGDRRVGQSRKYVGVFLSVLFTKKEINKRVGRLFLAKGDRVPLEMDKDCYGRIQFGGWGRSAESVKGGWIHAK